MQAETSNRLEIGLRIIESAAQYQHMTRFQNNNKKAFAWFTHKTHLHHVEWHVSDPNIIRIAVSDVRQLFVLF